MYKRQLQNHFEVLLCDSSGASRVVYDERNDRYVERVDGRTLLQAHQLIEKRFVGEYDPAENLSATLETMMMPMIVSPTRMSRPTA